ncbi:hypothetical protein [Haloglycomyces albus]|uniref:hypothetical protein n=1 Tax=Haloglycomyces albus TaxID=526067 RepID=UPI00046C9D1D|nr:hypothetical protein [Haloglycomyces albus]
MADQPQKPHEPQQPTEDSSDEQVSGESNPGHQQPLEANDTAPAKKKMGAKLAGIGGAVALAIVVILAKGWIASLFNSGEDSVIDGYSAGDCIPAAPVEGDREFEEAIPCDDDNAFYEVTSNVDVEGQGYDASVDETGVEVVADVCGEEYGKFNAGRTWLDGTYAYDQETNEVEIVLCLQAIDKADADGYVPAVPGEGDCFDSNKWRFTVDCESDLADMRVDTFSDLPDPMTSEEEAAEYAECTGLYHALARGSEIIQVMCITEL